MNVSTHERRSGSSLTLLLGGLACLGLAAWTAVDLFMPHAGGTEISSADPSTTSTTTGQRPSRFVTKKIEDVQPGDLVVARDDRTGEVERHEVVRLFRKKSDHLRILTFRHTDGTSQRIETTNEHPFWVAGSGWTNAEDLKSGDSIATADSMVAVLQETQLERHPEGVSVYNFEVENAHSYFVQQPNSRGPPLWVHNDCGVVIVEDDLFTFQAIVNQDAAGLAPRVGTRQGVFTNRVDWTAPKGTGQTYRVYQRNDIDWDFVRPTDSGALPGRGLTNAEAAARHGLGPILPDGYIATLHHSQQKSIGPLFEASTRYHNFYRIDKAPLHPYGFRQHPDFPMGSGRDPNSIRSAFQNHDSLDYWKWRGRQIIGARTNGGG